MVTRIKGLKISQVPELKEITGAEMIPYQYKCTNGKIAASTLADYISANLDPNDPTGQIGQLREDVDNLEVKVNELDGLKEQVDTNTADIADLNDRIGQSGGDAEYVNKKLEDFMATKGQPDGLASLDSDGKLNSNQLPDNVINIEGLQPITYAELKSKVDNNQLTPGVRYAITDYSCAYIMPAYNDDPLIEVEYPATDFKYIICTAITSNRLDENVEIIREEGKRKIIEAKYSIDPNTCDWTRNMTTKSPKGVIYYLKDEYNNSATYDFKHIKFRRWAILDITANTTIDTGTNTHTSPFKCYVRETTRPLPDNRMFCGCGCLDEESFVPDVFNGLYRCGGEESPRYPGFVTNPGYLNVMYPFHEDYIKRDLKPYTDTNYPADKYLAWQTDMYAQGGLSSGWYTNCDWIGGMPHVDVDANDYLDRYTFDYDGQDASEMDVLYSGTGGTGTIPFVRDTHFEQNTLGITEIKLPDTVIAISKSVFEGTSEENRPNAFIRTNNFNGNASRNTILLNRANPNRAVSQIVQNVFGGDGNQFGANLIIVNYLFNSNRINGRYNYINGTFNKITINEIANNVFFGYYHSITGIQAYKNLFFGSDAYVKLSTDNNWSTVKDGEYSYASTIKDNFYANIVTGIEYATFEPHFNCNFFSGIYNKGIYTNGNVQVNDFRGLRWGTEIGYGCSGVFFGVLNKVSVPPFAFAVGAYADNLEYINGIERINRNSADSRIPSLHLVEMLSSYPAQWKNIKTDIVNDWEYPTAPCNRRVLFVNNQNKWQLSKWNELLVQNTVNQSEIVAANALSESIDTVTYQDYVNAMNEAYPPFNNNPELDYYGLSNIF